MNDTMRATPFLSSAKVSSLQAAVYVNIATGKGHTVVQARAGSGKTTTIMGALASVPAGLTIGLFAFNKSIAAELARRAPKGVEVKTLHAHGFAACRRAFRNVRVEDNKSRMICYELFGEPEQNETDPIRTRFREISDVVAKAKDTLVAMGDHDALDALIDAFQIDAPEDEETRLEFVRACMRVLVRSAELTAVVDFSDMCWLPVVLGLRVWAYDRVFVDETQDLSPAQIELLLMTVKKGGRICAVGDDRQAIYAFRGADVRTMPNLIARLNATVLPLSVTYRCSRAVVALARQEVSDLTAADGAPEGSVTGGYKADGLLKGARPGDMVISRTNAPLLGLCLKLLASGVRATVKGRDVASGLIALIKRSRAKTIPQLETWIAEWHAREAARLERRDRPTTDVDDKRACIEALTEGLATVAELIARIEGLFSESDGDADRVTLGTTHKLKGLEADRVWMLEDTYRRAQGGEEANCWYVAVTRAKTDLRMVAVKEENPAKIEAKA